MNQADTLLTDLITLERGSDSPLHRQLYQQVRHSILGGKLQGAFPLPPSRKLAAELRVSRNTVTTAYDQLKAEGLICASIGSSTRVVDGWKTSREVAMSAMTSAHSAKRLESLPGSVDVTPLFAGDVLLAGFPDPREFPSRAWNQHFNQANSNLNSLLPSLDICAGFIPLRKALSQYLAVSRDVSAHPGQIFVTAGASQSLWLMTRVLTNPWDTAWFEEPGYPVAKMALQLADLNVNPVGVDGNGLSPVETPANNPRLIYMTTSYQYPLGFTMPINRRLEWLELAKQTDAWLVEDDYDGEFRYRGKPIPAMAGLNDNQRTLYMGTFSKVLSPSLRISYVVVPQTLIEPFRQVYPMLGNESSIITQATLAQLIQSGAFAKQVKRVRKLYGERRKTMVQACREYFNLNSSDDKLIPGGLHIPLHIDGNDHQLHDDLIKNRLGCTGLSGLYQHTAKASHGLMLGFTSRSSDTISRSIKTLAKILKRHRISAHFG